MENKNRKEVSLPSSEGVERTIPPLSKAQWKCSKTEKKSRKIMFCNYTKINLMKLN